MAPIIRIIFTIMLVRGKKNEKKSIWIFLRCVVSCHHHSHTKLTKENWVYVYRRRNLVMLIKSFCENNLKWKMQKFITIFPGFRRNEILAGIQLYIPQQFKKSKKSIELFLVHGKIDYFINLLETKAILTTLNLGEKMIRAVSFIFSQSFGKIFSKKLLIGMSV